MKLTNPLKNIALKKYPDGQVFQWYAENPSLYKAAVNIAFHNGIDIATFDGDEVLATHDGEVIEAYNAAGGYGHHVRLLSNKQEDGTYVETIYGHLRPLEVKVGDKFKAGEKIGLESNSGFVISGGTSYWNTAPAGKGVHLHFGVRILTDSQPNTYQISYHGRGFSILNAQNGVYGYEDPMLFLQTTMLNLYREVGREPVYAKINEKYYWISPNAMPDLVRQGLANWNSVKEVSEKIIQEGCIS